MSFGREAVLWRLPELTHLSMETQPRHTSSRRGCILSKTIAVVGGSGFLGGEVLRQLSTDHTLRLINIDRVQPSYADHAEYVAADLRDADSLVQALAGSEIAILLAAEWNDNVRPISRYYEVNVEGTRNFVEAARRAGIRQCIFTSSVSIYGPTSYEVDENHPPKPINDYGKSKLEAEDVLRTWSSGDSSLSLVIIRPTVIFGPGNRGNVFNLLRQMASKTFAMVGDGENRKSMAYVENVAAFVIHCLSSPAGTHIFNYADKPDPSMNELVEMIEIMLGRRPLHLNIPRGAALAGAKMLDAVSVILKRPFAITSERVAKFCANTQYSAEAAFRSGFVPPVSLREALERTIASDFSAENGKIDAKSHASAQSCHQR